MPFHITLQNQEKQTEVNKTPMELMNEEAPTKTRFSGRKSIVDMFDSTTQIIDTKV